MLSFGVETFESTPEETAGVSDRSPAEPDAVVFGLEIDPAAARSFATAAPRCRKPDCDDIGFEVELGPADVRSPCKPELEGIFEDIELCSKAQCSPCEPERGVIRTDVEHSLAAARCFAEPERLDILDGSSSTSESSHKIQGLPASEC